MLPTVGGQEVGSVNHQLTKREGYTEFSRLSSNVNLSQGYHFLIANSWSNFRRVGQQDTVNFQVYTVPEGMFRMARPIFHSRNMLIKVVDSSGNILATGRIGALIPSLSAVINRTLGKHEIKRGAIQGRVARIDVREESLNLVFVFPSLFLDRQGAWDGFQPGTHEHKQQVPFDLSREQMERIIAVHISLEQKQSFVNKRNTMRLRVVMDAKLF